MQHAEHLPSSFPWRISTVVVGAIALVELVALITIGAVQLAPRHVHGKAAAAAASSSRQLTHVRHVAAPLAN